MATSVERVTLPTNSLGDRFKRDKPCGFYPGEADTLKRLKEFDAAGRRATDIARTLNLEGRKARSGGDWLQPAVSKILNRKKRAD